MNQADIGRALPPGVPRLFADLLREFERVERFYAHPPSLVAAASAAKGARLGAEHRRRLVDALARQNPQAAARESLDRLSSKGTVAVVTGQQVGLLGGPVFTLYKALTAVRCADELSARGIPAVPVFWMATEDHDLAEVNHAWAWRSGRAPVRIEAATASVDGAAVGDIAVTDARLAEFSSCWAGDEHALAATRLAAEHYSAPTDFGRSFRGLYGALLENTGILFLCPMAAAVRELAMPLLREAIRRTPELGQALLRRGRELRSAGYHEQVRFLGSSSLLMLFEGAKRTALRCKNGTFLARDRAYSGRDLFRRLEADPLAVSPSAILRPVVQDYLLPTAALITGPSEASYLAQSAVVYDTLIGRMPAVLPRASFTVVDQRSRKLLAKYGLRVADCMGSRAGLEAGIASRLVPPRLRDGIDGHRAAIDRSLDGVGDALRGFDPTLADAFRTSRRKIRYQLDKTAAKVGRESLRRNATAGHHADTLARWLHPGGQSQERVYSVMSFVARFGPAFPSEVLAAIEPGCGDHRLLEV